MSFRSTSPDSPHYQRHTTFASILESDHAAINRGAQRLKNALSRKYPEADILAVRDEVIWRLIRHDISEEIVMRPAFEKYLGEEGMKMVEGDRKDHGDAKHALQKLMSMSTTLPAYAHYVDTMMAELAEHMKRESGHEIPKLESVLSSSQSKELARRYARTQRLRPDLRVPRAADTKPGKAKADLVPAFAGLEDYLATPMARFLELLPLVPDEDEGRQAEAEDGDDTDSSEKAAKEERRKSRL